MPHQDVTQVVQAEIRFFLGSSNAQNTLHARCAGVPGPADLADLGAVIDAWIETEWAPIASEDWTANEIVLTSLDSITGPRISIPISPPVPGTLSSDAMPANVTIAVKEDIGRRGRGTAGRVFWVGLAESQVNGNQVESAAATAILAALETLRTNVEGLSNYTGLCVPHLTVAGVHPDPAGNSLVAQFILSDLYIDSQKDRLPFHKKKKLPPVA